MQERSISNVPKIALAVLCLSLMMQIAWHFKQPPPQAKAVDLRPAPSLTTLKIANFGEPIALAKMLMIYLQSFDNQPGISIPFRDLNYATVQGWLGRMLELDPPAQYPLLAASHLYAGVSDEPRQRQMLAFIYQRFSDDPNRRWPALAHAAFIAKHRLKDLPLARQYAQAIRLQATGKEVPSWATQMEIFILEDMNELDSARILIGGLLQSGQISDPHELRFFDQRLKDMNAKAQAP